MAEVHDELAKEMRMRHLMVSLRVAGKASLT